MLLTQSDGSLHGEPLPVQRQNRITIHPIHGNSQALITALFTKSSEMRFFTGSSTYGGAARPQICYKNWAYARKDYATGPGLENGCGHAQPGISQEAQGIPFSACGQLTTLFSFWQKCERWTFSCRGKDHFSTLINLPSFMNPQVLFRVLADNRFHLGVDGIGNS